MADRASSVPPMVGRYVLHGEIASGGMATVHFGRLQGAAGFTRSVAIKRLHPQFAKDPDFVAMFVDEARLAARIAHPNVVPTLDVVSQDDELLLVMEYVRGASLSRLLRTLGTKRERVPPRIAAAVLSGVLHGLHAAHEARSETGDRLDIVHRDVSPQNILVGTDGVARVLDFGVAKAAGRWQSTGEGQLKGKIAYMAPEQIAHGSVTRKTDVYAAAVVLWETLTGRRLFRADNEAKLIGMVLRGGPPAPSETAADVPSGFDRVVERGLHRDPDRRFATAREMAAEVEAVVGTAPPIEVGAWVDRVAAAELRARADRINEIERSVASSRSSPRRLLGQGSSGGAIGRARDTAAAELESQESHLAMVHADPLRPRQLLRKWRWIAVAATLLALGAIGTSIAALQWSRRTRVATPTLVATAVPTATSTAGATQAIAPAPIATPGFSAAALPAARVPVPPRAPRAPVVPIHAPAAPPRPDCTPPYTADHVGHLHFKPECL